MNRYSFCICTMVMFLFCACNSKPSEDRPSGLKNMAPPPIQEALQTGLDVEPNNTFLQAGDITLTGDAIQWEGTLSPEDQDVWHIKAKAGTVAEISIIPDKNIDLVVDYAPSANESARRYYDVTHDGETEILPNVRLTPNGGYLTIKSRHKSETGEVPYRVQIHRVQPEQGIYMESEPNDGTDAMNTVNSMSVRGILYPSGDVDFYRISIENAGTFSFQLPNKAVEVAVLSNDQKLWSAISRQEQTLQSDIIQNTGTPLTVTVKPLDNIEQILQYAFTFEPLAEIPDEIEPNDTIDKAQQIQGDMQTLEFSLSNTNDVDIFQVDLSANQDYHVRLVGPEPGQARIQLIDRAGNIINDVISDDFAICSVSVADDKKLYLKVSSGSAGNIVFPQKYRIQIDPVQAEGKETEPNQNRLQAMDLPMDSTVYGHVFPAGDVDNYRITVPGIPGVTGPVGELSIDIEAGYVASLQLNLQDAEGFEISQVKNTQYSSPIHLSFDAPAGVYNLEVTGGGDGCAKPYILKASLKPSQNLQENTNSFKVDDLIQEDTALNHDSAGSDAAADDIDALIKAAQQSNAPKRDDADEDAF